jgi:hypothetical protein
LPSVSSYRSQMLTIPLQSETTPEPEPGIVGVAWVFLLATLRPGSRSVCGIDLRHRDNRDYRSTEIRCVPIGPIVSIVSIQFHAAANRVRIFSFGVSNRANCLDV